MVVVSITSFFDSELFIFAEDPAIAYIMYVENGRSGVLKRSGMDIDVLSTVHKLPVYSVRTGLHLA